MPCIHTTLATCLRGKFLYDLCSPYYTSEYCKGTYSKAIYPVMWKVDWVVLSLITCTPILPSLVRRSSPSEPPTRHKRSRYESTTRLRKCTYFGQVGNNRTICSNPNVTQIS